MDDAHSVIEDGDVLIIGTDIAAVGRNLEVPEGTVGNRHGSGGIIDARHDRYPPPHVANRDAQVLAPTGR